MRALDVALTSLLLRYGAPKPPCRERRLVPAVDDADAAFLDRAALGQEQAALVASLWPGTLPCVVGARYDQAPAFFVTALRVSWQAPEDDQLTRAESEFQVSRAITH